MCLVAFQKIFRKIFSGIWKRRRKTQPRKTQIQTLIAISARDLAGAIRDLTEGNAFLVCELWRALVETGTVELGDGPIRITRPLTEIGSPESVREVVSQRLSRLAPWTTDLLELAAPLLLDDRGRERSRARTGRVGHPQPSITTGSSDRSTNSWSVAS